MLLKLEYTKIVMCFGDYQVQLSARQYIHNKVVMATRLNVNKQKLSVREHQKLSDILITAFTYNLYKY